MAEAAGQPDALRLLLSNVQLVASIFYSLNSPGLTEVGGAGGGQGQGQGRAVEPQVLAAVVT